MKLKIIYAAWFAVVFGVFSGECEAFCPVVRSAVKRKTSDGRISGGQVTAPHEFPWQAYIQVHFWSGSVAVCGGSLISEEWILSAAHCFFGATNITVTLGAHDTSAASDDAHRQVFNVTLSSINAYPDWFYPDLEGDIALIQLPSKASINSYVSPISLPYTNDDSSFEKNPVVLTGWGNFSSVPESGYSPKLQKSETTVLGSLGLDADCQSEAELNFDGAKIICGDGKASHRFCYGDDGGPMNYYRSEESDWVVVGVATAGDSSTNCASSTKPSLYTRVSYYLDWIHNNTQIPPSIRTTTTSTTVSTTTTTTVTREPLSLCRGNPDGYYPIPGEPCTKYFVECREETAYILECLELDTVYSADYCWCDYPYNVPGCPAYTVLPSSWFDFERK